MTDQDKMQLSRRRLLAMAGISASATLIAPHVVFGEQDLGAVHTTKEFRSGWFAPLKQIDAGLLNVFYAEAGPGDGPPVILLHGWPYDIYSFVDVAPILASHGFRVIVPYLRGYGSTHFLSSETFRNGQPSALAQDVVSLMDAVKINRRSSLVSTGVREPQTSWRRYGRSGAKPWFL